jgi:hypothetical protein
MRLRARRRRKMGMGGLMRLIVREGRKVRARVWTKFPI